MVLQLYVMCLNELLVVCLYVNYARRVKTAPNDPFEFSYVILTLFPQYYLYSVLSGRHMLLCHNMLRNGA
jgi:hypothetical protein